MVAFACRNLSKDAVILDLGCGNGHLLGELFRSGYMNLCGIDYSQKSIELARTIAESHGMHEIEFIHADILQGGLNIMADLVCDKGTFDAVSLGPVLETGVAPEQQFVRNLLKCLHESSTFLITSCNWTSAELRQIFESEGYTFVQEIEYPKFLFGGARGQNISTLAFRPS
jgi:2-polyprenyl-3-methyl-5-hydroxy-6-metoxy-1,4-benzoquinol methylase